jgi:hypothetical protein
MELLHQVLGDQVTPAELVQWVSKHWQEYILKGMLAFIQFRRFN